MKTMTKTVTITRIPTSEIREKLKDPDRVAPDEKAELEKILQQREMEKKKKK